MSDTYTWIYLCEDGSPCPELPEAAALEAFETREEAEVWLGQNWEALLEGGVDAVTLYEGATELYGPMSIAPAAE